MARRDIIAGFLILLFGLFTLTMSLSYSYTNEYGPGPGFWPLWLSLILIGLSLLMLLTALKSFRSSQEVNKASVMFENPKVFFKSLGTFFLAVFLLNKLGFVISICIAVTLFVRLVKPNHPWQKALLIGLISSLILFVLFNYGLGISLPKGVLQIL